MIYTASNKLIRKYEDELLQIEPYGKNSFRVRVTHLNCFLDDPKALLPPEEISVNSAGSVLIQIATREAKEYTQNVNSAETVVDNTAVMTNGKITVTINKAGKLRFTNERGEILLEEFEYARRTSLKISSRELKNISGESFKASLKFDSNPDEKLYGMGQYQNGIFDLKGSFLELAQRNSQVSVPFVYSSLGCGFLWNNPAVGKVSFGKNITEWEAYSTREIDFWITAGDSPSEILQQYTAVTGRAPMMPEYGLGFWQCKLRYRTQEELLSAAREYHRRDIPLDIIIADFFHWTYEGTWDFDRTYWPDPEAMVQELKEMGTRLMVSVWPTVSVHAPDYDLMKENNLLVRTNAGVQINKLMIDPTSFADMTNPDARKFVWDKLKKNYCDIGIKDFWLDVAEPEYSSYDFENYRYYAGAALEVSNRFPLDYTRMIYDGLTSAGEKDIVTLVRCAWAGSQKYGALVWSGDIPSSFDSLRIQIVCGLHMAMAGIPWWNTDIGGFHGANVNDPEFRELLVRWFQYAAFCPVMRLHGHRQPFLPPMSKEGGGRCGSGADNEIWAFGNDNYEIMKKYIEIREEMRPYTRKIMKETSETGNPVMRPLFYAFPDDKKAWDIKDQYLFGRELLAAPVTEYRKRERSVYLPAGSDWKNVWTDKVYSGGQTICVDAPLDIIPVFARVKK